METIDERRQKAARNQSLFRDVNERIEQLTGSEAASPSEAWEFLCECVDTQCTEMIRLTPAEYEAIRGTPTRFPVKAGHELLDVERVVEETDGYVVVEKLGEGGRVATERDPRRRDTAISDTA